MGPTVFMFTSRSSSNRLLVNVTQLDVYLSAAVIGDQNKVVPIYACLTFYLYTEKNCVLRIKLVKEVASKVDFIWLFSQ